MASLITTMTIINIENQFFVLFFKCKFHSTWQIVGNENIPIIDQGWRGGNDGGMDR